MLKQFLLLSVILLGLVSGCQTAPSNQPYIEHTQQADIMMGQNQYRQAAKLYQKLAHDDPQQAKYRLLAGEALLKSGDTEKARQLLNSLPQQSLTPSQQALFELLQAQLNLSEGNDEFALEQLSKIPLEQLDLDHKRDYFKAKAFAEALSGNLLASIQSRIQLSKLLLTPDAIQKNNTAIFELLNRLPPAKLAQLQETAPPPLAGWAALANLLKQPAPDHDQQLARLENWQMTYPNHPANGAFIAQLLSRQSHFNTQPATIAVLLPESGRFARAAAIIKTGLQTAHANSGSNASLIFYDSSTSNPIALYRRAVEAGAELVIGPLQKEKIAQLATLDTLPVSVIALNQIDSVSRENLLQFGLNPQDESREITQDAWQTGHRKALFLTPDSHKGKRILAYLTGFWQQSGGAVLETQAYSRQQYDFSDPIKRLMNEDSSERRYRKLVRKLNRSLQFTPRARTDADAIFIMATTAVARTLIPQLKFYGAPHTPVYTPSPVYTGFPSPRQDKDLDGLHFCDIPWFFPDIYQQTPTLDSMQDKVLRLPNRYRRLLALGLDAYMIIPFLNTMSDNPVPGATGLLSRSPDNHIMRHLVCAEFSQGYPANAHFLLDEQPVAPDSTVMELE